MSLAVGTRGIEASIVDITPNAILQPNAPFSVVHEGRAALVMLALGPKDGVAGTAIEQNHWLQDCVDAAGAGFKVGYPNTQADWQGRVLVPSGVFESSRVGQTTLYRPTKTAAAVLPLAGFFYEFGSTYGKSITEIAGPYESGATRQATQLARIAGIRYIEDHLEASAALTNEEARQALGVKSQSTARNIMQRLANAGLWQMEHWDASRGVSYERTPQITELQSPQAGKLQRTIVALYEMKPVVAIDDIERVLRAAGPAYGQASSSELRHLITSCLFDMEKRGQITKRVGIASDGKMIISRSADQARMAGEFLEGFDKYMQRDRPFLKKYDNLARDFAHDPTAITDAICRYRFASGIEGQHDRSFLDGQVLSALQDLSILPRADAHTGYFGPRAVSNHIATLDGEQRKIDKEQVYRSLRRLAQSGQVTAHPTARGILYAP